MKHMPLRVSLIEKPKLFLELAQNNSCRTRRRRSHHADVAYKEIAPIGHVVRRPHARGVCAERPQARHVRRISGDWGIETRRCMDCGRGIIILSRAIARNSNLTITDNARKYYPCQIPIVPEYFRRYLLNVRLRTPGYDYTASYPLCQ